MDKWHYFAKICTLRDLERPHKLDDLGDAGWELVAVERLGTLNDTQLEWLLVFKQRQTL
jgi:hypothetical protein